jgi:Ca2+-binding RTX toxin-like protein
MRKNSALTIAPLVLGFVVGCGSNSSNGRTTMGAQTVFFPIVGTNGNDTITGTPMTDTLRGLGGNDTITALASDDFIDPGPGNDMVFAGEGDDFILGDQGNDTIDGGPGSDTVSYASSPNSITVLLTLTTAQSGGDAQGDILANIENIEGSGFNDTITGDGMDNIILGGPGADMLDGGAGTADFVSYRGSNAGAVTINLNLNTASGGDAQGDVLVNFEGIIGSNGADMLTGSDLATGLFEGGPGADRIIASGVTGGITFYDKSPAAVTVSLLNSNFVASGGDAEGDDFGGTPIFGIQGSEFSDNLTASNTFNCLVIGLGGDDVINGDIGADQLVGGDGNDIINGGDSGDLIQGGAGADTINGGAGDDQIDYGQDDILIDFGTATNGFESLNVTADADLGTGPMIRGVGCILVPVTGAGAPITLTIDPPDLLAPITQQSQVFVDPVGFIGTSACIMVGKGWVNMGVISMFGLNYTQFDSNIAGTTTTLFINVGITDIAGVVP